MGSRNVCRIISSMSAPPFRKNLEPFTGRSSPVHNPSRRYRVHATKGGKNGGQNIAELTREELYRLVWQKPMRTLVGEFGLSDRGLSKICVRMNIPVPPRGYWAKKQAGKKVAWPKLPEAGQ